MPPLPGCPRKGPPSPEVTGAFCRVPSPSFSQAPRYSLPIHLCWFRVRSISWSYFLEHLHCLIQSNKKRQFTAFVTTARSRNINRVCIDYSLRPRLSSRLTPGGRTLPGKPYPYGDLDSNQVYRYLSPDSHFPKVHCRSRFSFIPAGTLSYRSSIRKNPYFRCHA